MPPNPMQQPPSSIGPSPQDANTLETLGPVLEQIHKHRHDRAKTYLVNALGNLVFSLGQGLQEGAKYPGARGGQAAVGAALQGPQILAQMRQKQAQEQSQAQADMIRAKADAQNADTSEKLRTAQAGNIAPTEVTNPFSGEKVTVPANQVGKTLADWAQQKQKEDAWGAQLDASNLKLGRRRQDMTKPYNADTNPYIPMQKGDPLMTKEYADQLTKTEAQTDYVNAMKEFTQAKTDLAKAGKDPAALKLAQEKADTAAQNGRTAAARLGLSADIFDRQTFGTNNGQALPGSMIGDNGQPVGTAFQQNLRPTAVERNKADLAVSAHDQLQDIKSIVQKRPDIFGPAAGRKTDFEVWVGSQDPDAQKFRAARTIAGDHLAGVFGGRSETALANLDSAIGRFKDNPAAVISGIDQLDKANQTFIKAGTVKTTGSNAAGAATGDTVVVYANGKPVTVRRKDLKTALGRGATMKP